MKKLTTQERRNRILELLGSSREPMTGSLLAEKFGVSRQVIVTDIQILRSTEPNLVATPRGYIMLKADNCRCVFKVIHTDEQIEDELLVIIELGGKVIDIYVDHKVYGTIRKPLDISSKRDVENYMKDITSGVSTSLKNITNGYHFHTIEARSEKILKEIETALKERGYHIETLSSQTLYEPKSYG